MKLKTLTIVVVLLALAASLVFWRNRQPVVDPTADPRVGRPLFERSALARLGGLSITGEGKTVVVAADATGKHWTVPDYFGLPADFSKLSSFVDNLQTAKILRLVTANPERLERLGFGTDKVELRDASGKAFATLVVGKTADSGGRFVRFGDEKKGYLADLSIWLDPTPKNWAQSQLIERPADEVATVSLKFDDGSTLTAKRAEKGTGWTAEGLPAGKEIKAGPIDSVVSQLTSLRFTETTEPTAPDAVAAKEHSRTVVLTLKDGTTYTVALGRRPAPPAPPAPPAAPTGATATTPAVTIGADGKPVVAAPASTTPPAAAPTETKPPAPAPQPGPVFVFINSNREADPVNGVMQKRAFEISDYALTSLPASRDAVLQDAPPAPAPVAAPATPGSPASATPAAPATSPAAAPAPASPPSAAAPAEPAASTPQTPAAK